MIGEVAAFDIDDMVKELRCMAAMGYGSAEWKKCACLQEQYPDKACGWCEYEHKDSNVSYDPDIANALCSEAADALETQAAEIEALTVKLRAAEEDIRMLLLRGIPGYNIVSVCTFCAENGAKRENCACDGKCEEKARWRGSLEESEEEHD